MWMVPMVTFDMKRAICPALLVTGRRCAKKGLQGQHRPKRPSPNVQAFPSNHMRLRKCKHTPDTFARVFHRSATLHGSYQAEAVFVLLRFFGSVCNSSSS